MRPGVILAAFIAVAAAAGISVSLIQRLPPSHPVPRITLAPVGPTAVPRQPSVAFAFSVADDASTGQVILFGGVSNFANTWAWNGATWTLLRPANRPQGRYDASAAFDPQSGQVLLLGGRLDVFDGRKVSVLVYRRNQHKVALTVTPAASDNGAPVSVTQRDGFVLGQWRHRGFEMRAVSDISTAEMESFASALDRAVDGDH